jgi:Lon protease-like protein
MIPIFPIAIVIYPGSRYPLHIFEERYRNMVRYSMKLDEPFGIIIYENDSLGRIGTKVKIESITKQYPDGSFDVIVSGHERFVMKTIKENSIGFFEADVEDYEDIFTGNYTDLEIELIEIFQIVIEKASYKLDTDFFEGLLSSKSKSFKIAEKAGLSLKQQQKLITLQNEGERIDFLIEHFKKVSSDLDSSESIRQIMLNDGYLN